MSIQEKIAKQIQDNPIILYMKGNKQFPQCGFSGHVVSLLNDCGADYTTVNVLEDPDIREGIKQYSQWPTIPQLYVQGEFIGGCDIVNALHQKGELSSLVAPK